jgi:type 2 lantibiotic biosynthesis protein LanM
MKEIVPTQSADTKNYWQSAAWYRATTLTERIAFISAKTSKSLTPGEPARQRLQRWKEQLPFNKDASLFERRLAMDRLTESDLLALLDEPLASLRSHYLSLYKEPPAWLTVLQHAFDAACADDTPLPLPATTEKNVVAFLTTIKPLLRYGLLNLQHGIRRLEQSYPSLPFDTETIIPLLFAQVPELILPRLLRTFALELNVARVQGRLQGETPEDRFQFFLEQLARPDGILPLLEEYAVLARFLVEAVERWTSCSLELLEHLCADWQQIRALFLPNEEPGVLVEVQTGKGDRHRGGRSVTILTWQSGFRLVYKPHSMSIDVHFQGLLSWLNASGYQPSFRTTKVLDKHTHGWMEYIQFAPCSSPEEVARFYQRQGGYLALLYALEASDFHAENLIAFGEHPMLVDLEALFQPHATLDEHFRQEYPGLETINSSVLRTGLLPQRLWSTEEREGIDVSGLGGQRGQLTPKPVAHWTGIGTDQMHMCRERLELTMDSHRPRLLDQEIDTLAYCESIIAGFTTAYRLLAAHREELLQDILPRFAQDEIRCVLRPTYLYNLLIADSFHPNLLRDALERDCLVDRLWFGAELRPYLPMLIAAERADVLIGDVPVFTTRPDVRDLFTSRGERIADFFELSALESVNVHLQRFNEEDLERQLWVIRASFTSMTLTSITMRPEDVTPGNAKSIGRILQLRPAQEATDVASTASTISAARFLHAAQAVGERLNKLALRSSSTTNKTDDTVGWLGVKPFNEREWHLLPTDADLYSGNTGIALFLAYLGALSGEPRYTELARLAQRSARYQVKQQVKRDGVGNIGGFCSLGAYIYLLSHLGSLWHEPAMYREAEEFVRMLPEAIGQDQTFDIIGGAAGCLAVLLSLHSVAPSQETLAVARQCGDHLLACAQRMPCGIGWVPKNQEVPLTGFAHGNAGVALSLLRLASVSGEECFRQAAREAMAYERVLFSPDENNWPDLRQSQKRADGKPAYMVAWCYGAPGVGLARLASLALLDDATFHAEIEAALSTTLAHGFGRNHSLCHGDMGNLDLLLKAVQLLPQAQQYELHVKRISSMLLESFEAQEWVTGVPLGIETPGLMVGIAGIGYALLRLANPTKVPSILLLEPPL